MSKQALEQVQALVNRLTTEEKVLLVRRLERATAKVRWTRLFAEIDRQRKGRRFSMAEIQREIDAVRRERRNGSHSRRR